MQWRRLAVAVLFLAVAGCGGRQASAPSPGPAPTAPSSGTSPGPVAVVPRATEAGLLSYPGAKQTSSSSFSGAGPTGTIGQWTTVSLETADPFEKVRDYFKANAPQGYAQSYSADQNDESGRSFVLWFARADGKAWYTIAVKEEKSAGKVVISAASGSAP